MPKIVPLILGLLISFVACSDDDAVPTETRTAGDQAAEGVEQVPNAGGESSSPATTTTEAAVASTEAPTTERASTTSEATTTEATTTAVTTTTTPAVDPVDYFEAINSSGVDDADALVADAAPGSPAELYGRHQVNVRVADGGGGVSRGDTSVVVRNDEVVVCEDDLFAGGQFSANYSSFVVDQGLLYSFEISAEGGPKIAIDDGRLGANGASNEMLGGTAQVLSSYRSATDILFVVVEIEASASLNLNLFSASYVDPTGRQVEAVSSVGPSEVREGARATAYVVFEQASPGGRLFIPVSAADFSSSADFVLDVPVAAFE